MSDDVLICRCCEVRQNEIINAIRSGHNSLDSIKLFTGASTGCGRCTGAVKSILQQSLME